MAERPVGTLTVLIPAHNEGAGIVPTLFAVSGALRGANIAHEVLVVLDHCTDDTAEQIEKARVDLPVLRATVNTLPGGYGFAIRHGLDNMRGDAVVIVMADGSDDPRDVVNYYRQLEAGFDCAFGSRFVPGATVRGYPAHKLWLNRMGNLIIRLMFRMKYNDTTNAFKAFRKEVIDGLRPFLSNHFNLTVELPLKAIVRGYSWTVVPTNWYGRDTGESKFKIDEMGSRYFFIIFYCLIEKYFSRGDYRRPLVQTGSASLPPASRGAGEKEGASTR
jgi:dolichol-phosphate mannosyltransferase